MQEGAELGLLRSLCSATCICRHLQHFSLSKPILDFVFHRTEILRGTAGSRFSCHGGVQGQSQNRK